MEWPKKLTINIVENDAWKRFFVDFVCFITRMTATVFFSFFCYKYIIYPMICYIAHPTHAIFEWRKNMKRTEKKTNQIFFFASIYYSTINSFIITFGSIIYLSALLSTSAICNVCGSANNSNFQFPIINVDLITEQKNPSKLPFSARKKENGSFPLTVSFIVNNYNTSSLFFVCRSWSTNVYVNPSTPKPISNLYFEFFFHIKRYGPDSNDDIDRTKGRLHDVL
jgi:hypothetical protein